MVTTAAVDIKQASGGLAEGCDPTGEEGAGQAPR
jgi:hypothetical protein